MYPFGFNTIIISKKMQIYNIVEFYQLMVNLMYGCGLRMKEVQNISHKRYWLSQRECKHKGFDKIYIWDSKSLKDRTLPLPLKIKEE